MLAMAAAIFMATFGLKGMIEAFSLLNVEQMVGLGVAFVGLGLAIAAMAYWGIAAAPGLLAIGAGLSAIATPILILGAAVFLAGAGMMLFGSGIEKLAAVDPAMYGNIVALLLAIGVGGMLLFPAAIGMLAFSASLLGLAFALLFIPTRDLEAIALFTSSLAEMELSNMRELASLVERIAEAMDTIPVFTTVAFSGLMGSVAAAALGAAALARTVVGMPGGDAGLAAPTGAGTGGAQQGQIAEVTVNLELDGEILAKKIVKVSRTQRGVEASEAAQNIGGRAYR